MPTDVENNTIENEQKEQDNDVQVHGKLDQHNNMLSGIARIGRVVEAAADDPEPPGDIPRVLVQIGGVSVGSFIRNWLPWTTTRAGYDGEWWQPELDEQVLVLAPSGNVVQGIILGSLYRGSLTFDSESGDIKARDPIPGDADGAAETDKFIHQRIYQDGTSITYDRTAHNLAVELKSAPGAEASLRFGATMDPEGGNEGTGTATLKIGKEKEPDIDFTVDSRSGDGGELTLVSKLKTTLIAGTADDPKVTILADATSDSEQLALSVAETSAVINKDGEIILTSGETTSTIDKNGAIILSAGATKVTINKDGAIAIDAGSNDIAITGNVAVSGTLDVS